MKRILLPLLRGRNVCQYYTSSEFQQRIDALRRSRNSFQIAQYSKRQLNMDGEEFDDEEDMMDNQIDIFDEDAERTTWQKIKRAMIWKKHYEEPDPDDEIDEEEPEDPNLFVFGWRDYVFWVYLAIAGVLGLVFMKLQSLSKPFYMDYIPAIRRTIENLDNKVLFKIVQEKAWNRILPILEDGFPSNREESEKKEDGVNKGSDSNETEKFYYHKNFELILKSVFGDDVKKKDLRLLNTNFICKPSHVFYMFPIVSKRFSWLKKMIFLSYYETRFEIFLPVIHQKTKICCIVKVCLKTKTDPNRMKKNIIRPKIQIPLTQPEDEEGGEEEGVDTDAADYIPEHQRVKDTLSDIDFENEEQLEELEKTLTDEEKQLSKKELKRYVSLVEEEERRVREERKKIAKDLGIPKQKKKRHGLFGYRKKDDDAGDGLPEGPPEFIDIDVEIENVSLVHVKKILNNYDASYFNQLPLRLVNESLKFNWPYETEQYQVKTEEELEVEKLKRENLKFEDPEERKRKKLENIDEIIIIKNEKTHEKINSLSDKVPVFCHSGNDIQGFIVPTHHESRHLPDHNDMEL